MFIYRVAISIQQDLAEEYLQWLKPHAQDLIDTGCFVKFHILKQKEEGSKAHFCCDYYYRENEDFERYEQEFSGKLRSDIPVKFTKSLTLSRTIFAVIV